MPQEPNDPQNEPQRPQSPYWRDDAAKDVQSLDGEEGNVSRQRDASVGAFGKAPDSRSCDRSVDGGYWGQTHYDHSPASVMSADNPYMSVPPSRRGGSHGWIVAIIGIVALALVMMFGVWSCSNVLSVQNASDADDIDLLVSDTIGIITIDGEIQYDGTTNSPEGLKTQLDRAAQNDHIKAVVLRVNSGGGVATAGEEMATYVRQFKEDTGKPVVVSSAANNCSAAYEISSQADCIFVAKTTAIGAIGTAMQVTDYSGLLKMLGITTDNITSATSKDSTYGTRSLTDEERAYYQNQIDQINQTFIENVSQGRNMTIDEVKSLATGLTFTGLEAVDNGLADEVGTQEDAVAKAAELAGSSSYSTIALESSRTDNLDVLLDLLSESKSSDTDELIQSLEELSNDDSIK